ncbi:MAG: recombination mediator RecR [Mangrovicoccus sp.]|nr:recombination mediator RecR [Mangrovicoccus sp.]
MAGPDSAIDRLITLMAKLPGLGPRSARRAVLYMIRKRALLLIPLADALSEVAQTARNCVNCGNVATDDLCEICRDPRRQNGTICVVEDVADLWAMERSHVFQGRYHVLGGTLSALEDRGPDELGLPRLIQRLESEEVEEVILALNATVDGQTTAHYIADMIEDGVMVSSLAQGVPVGGELDYLDDGTITAAMLARKGV